MCTVTNFFYYGIPHLGGGGHLTSDLVNFPPIPQQIQYMMNTCKVIDLVQSLTALIIIFFL